MRKGQVRGLKKGLHMSSLPRDFKGIWICKDLWLDQRLSFLEKALMAEIDSLDCGAPEWCYASNEHFTKIFSVKERVIQKSLATLKKLGFIEVCEFDGRVRRLRSNLKTVYANLCMSEVHKNAPPPCTKVHPSSIGSLPVGEIPTKINKKEKKKKKENSAPPRTATTSKIGFNAEERKFTGITESDLKAWREKFTGLNLDKELALCAEWALTTRRDNYRKSILTWLRNVQHSRGEKQFAGGASAQPEVIVNKEDVMDNKALAEKWEDGSIGKLPHLYKIAATPTKIEFSMTGWTFELDYNMPTSEFIKLSKPALKKMRLI